MTDAYEIGIKLVLQDDITSGLAVIRRELDEVDRAVAVTNAAFAQLGSGSPRPEIASPVPNKAVPPPTAASVPSGTGDEAPVIKVSESVERRATVQPEPTPVIARDTPNEVVIPKTKTSPEASPIKAEKDSTDTQSIVRESRVERAVEMQLANPPSQPLASAPSIAPPQEGERVKPLIAVVQDQRYPTGLEKTSPSGYPSVSAPSNAVTSQPIQPAPPMFGSVTNVLTSRREERTSPAAALPPGDRPPPAPYAMGAPRTWPQPVRDASTHRSEQLLPNVRSAVPQPAPQSDGQEGSGSVLLDGRLIGQWLSESMAMDASRPPSGTTYFDPRQTPAWTASGVL